MIILQIAMHAQTHTVAFETKESADATLDKLQSRLKEDRFSRNREEDKTYRIASPLGDVIVVLDTVQMARVVDTAIDEELCREYVAAKDDDQIKREIRQRMKLKEAGFSDT